MQGVLAGTIQEVNMIVTVRNWTLLRPVRAVWRAHKVSKVRSSVESEAQNTQGFFAGFEAMMTHAANLMIRNIEAE